MIKPNLHILGVQKAGTTALASFLQQHPDICVAKGKEAHVFDDPDYITSTSKQQFADNKYQQRFQHASNEQIYCDATPITLLHPMFLSACIEYNPKAQFIVVLRHPIERAFSQYNMAKAKNIEQSSATRAFLREILTLKVINNPLPIWPFEGTVREQSYLNRGRYCSQLETLFSLVSRQRVLVIWQHDLRLDHTKTLQRVYDFLGIEAVEVRSENVFTHPDTLNTLDRLSASFIAKLYFWSVGETTGKLRKLLNKNE